MRPPTLAALLALCSAVPAFSADVDKIDQAIDGYNQGERSPDVPTAAAVEPAKRCDQLARKHNEDKSFDLVRNPLRLTAAVPPGGWAGDEYPAWLEAKRASLGGLNLEALRADLAALESLRRLNSDYAATCGMVFERALGKMPVSRGSELKGLTIRNFMDAWPEMKRNLDAEREQIRIAIRNLGGAIKP
ncbi:MAG: hypothetical protein HY403_06835 [Elusimicrobia bacterium]|nr:hypothetical protein [Elusimicrobiota bacterium]